MASMKSILISEKTYNLLTTICPDDNLYDKIISEALKKEYVEEEELIDDEAEYCNKMIDRLENRDFTDSYEIDLDNLDEELAELESKDLL